MSRNFAALRGLAILIVVLHHSIRLSVAAAQDAGFHGPAGWERLFLRILLQVGVFAVPAFLFVSGSFWAYAAQGESPKLSYRLVWTGLRRLLWPYAVWSLLFYVTLYFCSGSAYSIAGYLKNLVVGFPYHFVPLLAFCYAVSPILVSVSRRLGWVIIGGIVMGQLVLINIVVPGSLGLRFPDWMEVLSPPILRNTLADWGAFFPLGLVYSLRARQAGPVLARFKWVSAAATVGLFVLSVLEAVNPVRVRLVGFLAALCFMFFLPCIRREAIPLGQSLEKVGTRSYGLYLSSFVVLLVVLTVAKAVMPGVLRYPTLCLPFVLAAAIAIPLVLMSSLQRTPARRLYPFIFG